MNERQLVADVLAVLKSHVDDPFLMGQIARAEDDIDLERPVPDFRHESQRFADYISCAAYARADSPDQLNRRHIYDAVLGALRDRDAWSATPPPYDPDSTRDRVGTTGAFGISAWWTAGELEYEYCELGTQGVTHVAVPLDEYRHLVGESSGARSALGDFVAFCRSRAPEQSEAHADDPSTDVEPITFRSTGRGAHEVIENRAEGPARVLAMVQFSEGVRGWRGAMERLTAHLASVSQDGAQ